MRPSRPGTLLAGAVVVVVSAVGLAALVAGAGERHQVLVVARPVAAGQQVGPDDVGVASIGAGDAIATTPAGRLDAVVGQYARFELAAGALLAPGSLQAAPLVTPGTVLMSVSLRAGAVPDDVAVGDHVVVVIAPDPQCAATRTVGASVVAITGSPAASGSSTAPVGLSLEVPATAAALLGTKPPAAIAVAPVAGAGADADACG